MYPPEQAESMLIDHLDDAGRVDGDDGGVGVQAGDGLALVVHMQLLHVVLCGLLLLVRLAVQDSARASVCVWQVGMCVCDCRCT